MLSELWIMNLAVLETVSIRFRPGLNALTGETGAGKSLIVGALDLVLGARASADRVRTGAREAEIVARFEPDPDSLEKLGLDEDLDESGALILRRVVTADGRSRSYVNDRPVTVSRLRELGEILADLHGQHEQQNLLREETHLTYLDAYASAGEELERVEDAYRRMIDAARERDAFLAECQQTAREREFLGFELGELDAADLRPGEEEALQSERHLVAHAEKLATSVEETQRALTEDDPSGTSLTGRGVRLLGEAAALDPSLEPLRRQLDEALVTLEDVSRELSGYQNRLNADPARLETLETRLALLAGLKRKYSAPIETLIERRETLRRRLENAEDASHRLQELGAVAADAEQTLQKTAGELSAIRSRAAARFSREVSRELTGLGMLEAKFSVSLSPPRQGIQIPGRPDPINVRGAEEATFVLAANPGEPGGPLGKMASGGEISRVMLALRNVLRQVDPVPLVIFDEVDAGIGGLVAEAVATRLALIARKRQVLVVTHLPVIAGRAEHHVGITKRTVKKRTRIQVQELSGKDREEELARMLAGTMGGEEVRETARALLKEGNRS